MGVAAELGILIKVDVEKDCPLLTVPTWTYLKVPSFSSECSVTKMFSKLQPAAFTNIIPLHKVLVSKIHCYLKTKVWLIGELELGL